MNEKRYTLIFADGTEIPDVQINGNNYIIENGEDYNISDSNLSPLVIRSNGGDEEIHEHAALVQDVAHEKQRWIVIRDITDEEIREKNMLDTIKNLTDELEATKILLGVE